MLYAEKCSDEETKKFSGKQGDDLPDNVDFMEETYKKYTKSELSDEELKIFALAKINSNLKIIKVCIIFFVVLAVIGIILGIVGLSQLSSAVHSAYSSTSSLWG